MGRAASVSAGPVAGAAFLTLIPTNTQAELHPLGGGVRVRTAPGQRGATVQRRVDGGLLGTGSGAKWIDLPVAAEWSTRGPSRQRVIAIDRQGLEQVIGRDAADTALGGSGIAMARPPLKDEPAERDEPGPGHNSEAFGEKLTPEPPEPGDEDPKPPLNPAPLVLPALDEQVPPASSGEEIKRIWGQPTTLDDHFFRHGPDFGATDPLDYARKAREFLHRAEQEMLPMKIDKVGTVRVGCLIQQAAPSLLTTQMVRRRRSTSSMRRLMDMQPQQTTGTNSPVRWLGDLDMPYICLACGYPGLNEEPRAEETGGSYEICPSCGLQFGLDDEAGGDAARRPEVYRQWRKRWINGGMAWHSRSIEQPRYWQPSKQLLKPN